MRRETAGAYLKAAGIAVRSPGGWGRRGPATPASELIPDSIEAKPANEVITDPGGKSPGKQGLQPSSPPLSASACEPYRATIELGVSRGRNAMAIWQDLVSQYGFSSGYQTVQRFVRKLNGSQVPQAVGIILVAPGEEGQVDYGTGPMVRDEQAASTIVPGVETSNIIPGVIECFEWFERTSVYSMRKGVCYEPQTCL